MQTTTFLRTKESTTDNFAATTGITQDCHRQTRTHGYPSHSCTSPKFENYEKLSSIFKNEGNFLLKITTLGGLEPKGYFLLPCPQSQQLIFKSKAKEQTAIRIK